MGIVRKANGKVDVDHYHAACWADEDPRYPPGMKYEHDRYDFIQELFESAVASDKAAG